MDAEIAATAKLDMISKIEEIAKTCEVARMALIAKSQDCQKRRHLPRLPKNP